MGVDVAPKKRKNSAKKSRKKPIARKKKPVAKKKKKTTAKKPTARKTVRKKTSAKKAKKPVRRKTATRKGVRKKRTVRKAAGARSTVSRGAAWNGTAIGGLNYRAIESEIRKLTELLQTIRTKNKLVKKSLAYLEKEQRKVAKQIQEARKYLTQLKNRGLKALRGFPDNAEEIFEQLKSEVTRLSKRLGIPKF